VPGKILLNLRNNNRATKLNPTPGRCLDYVSGVECCASSSMLFCFLCSKKQGKTQKAKAKAQQTHPKSWGKLESRT